MIYNMNSVFYIFLVLLSVSLADELFPRSLMDSFDLSDNRYILLRTCSYISYVSLVSKIVNLILCLIKY